MVEMVEEVDAAKSEKDRKQIQVLGLLPFGLDVLSEDVVEEVMDDVVVALPALKKLVDSSV